MDPAVDQALSVFEDAIARQDPRARRLWFDVTTVAIPDAATEEMVRIATRIQQLGVQRMLYGSDAASGTPPREGWAEYLHLFRSRERSRRPLLHCEHAVAPRL